VLLLSHERRGRLQTQMTRLRTVAGQGHVSEDAAHARAGDLGGAVRMCVDQFGELVEIVEAQVRIEALYRGSHGSC